MILWNEVFLTTNITREVQDETDSGVSLWEMANIADKLYLRLDRRFDGVYFKLGSGGSYSDLTWEYLAGEDESDDDNWANLPLHKSIDFSRTDVVQFRIPNDWEKDDNDYYSIRVSSGSYGGSTATLLYSFPFPEYAYTDVTEVERLLQVRRQEGGLTDKTVPSISDVERIIKRVEGRIEGYSTQAWKPKYIGEELYDFKRHGFVLRRYPVIDIIDLSMWRGSEYETLEEGRDGFYHIKPDTGVVNFSRLHSLPFTYTRNRHYGYGEYRNNTRVSYIWGKDIDFDDRAYMVRDIATKLTAVDVLSSYDFTALVPQGTDRYSIEARIQRWSEDADERLEELRPLRMWV